jgi:hypothetical protein
MTFLFWNLAGKPLSRIVAQYRVDVLMLAECEIPQEELNRDITEAGGCTFSTVPCFSRAVTVLTRFNAKFLKPVHEHHRFSILHLDHPGYRDLLLAAVHLPSKVRSSDADQAFECGPIARDIEEQERKLGHDRTVLAGDLNMNPFEEGVVAASGFHGVMARQVAQKGSRTVNGRQYPFFYNPMWSRMGDDSIGPPGTQYYSASGHVNYFWNTFDQVLMRPSVMEFFQGDELRVVTEIRNKSLLLPDGRPNAKAFSDHLPISFKLNLPAVPSDVHTIE